MGEKTRARARMSRPASRSSRAPPPLDAARPPRPRRPSSAIPVLIKAAAGGGGKGMRRVDRPADLDAAFEACRREASVRVRRRPRLS